MTASPQLRFWLYGLVAAAVALWLLSGMLAPFVAGMAIAYLLDPVCDRLQRLGVPRWLATTLVLLVFVVALIWALLILLPLVIGQVNGLIAALPGYVERAGELLEPVIAELRKRLSEGDFSQLQQSFSQYVGSAFSWAGTLLGGLWQGGMALFDILSLLVITPVVAFYMLRDWDRIILTIDGYLPRHQQPTIRQIARQVDFTLSRFIRGQLLVCLLLGMFYAVALSLVGLNFSLLVGVGTGVLSIIPYVGSLVGFVTSVGIALVQFDDWTMWAVVAGVFFLGQFLEGNFITPKLVGESVGLHPVWIMFALLAAGSLFGFTGVLLGVPVAAIIGVLVRFALGRYRDSTLYRGEEVPAAAPAEPDLPSP